MIIYHHSDNDGRCAGAIALRWGRGQIGTTWPERIETIEVDYGNPIDTDIIWDNESIIIIDFTFKPEVMAKVLEKTQNVTWIDHHASNYDYPYLNLPGIRDFVPKSKSGCELAWQYFFPGYDVPWAVTLIGDRDKWANIYPESNTLRQGLKLNNTLPESSLWDDLLFPKEGNLLNDIIKNGEICLAFRDSLCKDYCDKFGYEVLFEGYKCFVMGLHFFGSDAFGGRLKEYPICISYEFNGDLYIIGLYSETIDVSEICKRWGGGGHKGAGGFEHKQLPFSKI